MTSREVIPASSHLSFFQYKTEIFEKAKIVGKVSNHSPRKMREDSAQGLAMRADERLQGTSLGSHSCTAGYIQQCMGALRHHWSVGHEERCSRGCGTEGWWNFTKTVGMEKQILVLAEKLQGRQRN